MSPVSATHYRVNIFILRLIADFLDQTQAGTLFGPEFIVRLRSGLRRVPDLLYVASENAHRVRETVLEGPPDAVWEIISPDSERRDWQEKVPEYQDAGIREYWIVNPYVKTVWLLRLNAEGKYENIEAEDGKLASSVIPGFWLRPEWLWADPRPIPPDCVREIRALPPD
jgi:Uma2 family endonuclease